MRSFLFSCLIAVVVFSACAGADRSRSLTAESEVEAVVSESPTSSESGMESADAPTALEPPIQSEPTCEQRIDDRELDPLSERHERYIEALPYVIVRTRVVPVVYLSWPEATRSERAAQVRSDLEASRRPGKAIRSFLKSRGRDRALVREVFLSQGYLFEEDPSFARAVVLEVSLVNLFDEEVIYRNRGSRIEQLRRVGRGYLDESGQRASLLLNDRVAASREELTRPLHLDLDEVRQQTGALRTIPTALEGSTIALELIFPNGEDRPALVELDDDSVTVSCIGGDASTLEATLAEAQRFWEHHDRVTETAHRIVREQPRFDEPLDEPEGVQEDGQLRLAWREAYLRGYSFFKFREVEYSVFDESGNPTPPQVCVDFIMDTWERATGTWYRPEGESPERVSGRVDFSDFPGFHRRSIANILEYTEREEGPIERYDIPANDRVQLRREVEFARALARQADEIREGDALIIHGLRLQDMRLHYHSVLVLRTDPLTGVPMVVADNQGRPRVGSVVTAMRAAPLRAIKYRLRVDFASAERGVQPAGA